MSKFVFISDKGHLIDKEKHTYKKKTSDTTSPNSYQMDTTEVKKRPIVSTIKSTDKRSNPRKDK